VIWIVPILVWLSMMLLWLVLLPLQLVVFVREEIPTCRFLCFVLEILLSGQHLVPLSLHSHLHTKWKRLVSLNEYKKCMLHGRETKGKCLMDGVYTYCKREIERVTC